MHSAEWIAETGDVLTEIINKFMLFPKLLQLGQGARQNWFRQLKNQRIFVCFPDKMLYFYCSYLGVFKSVAFVCNYLKYNTLHPLCLLRDEFFGLMQLT